MPFGAVARGDIDGLNIKDNIKIALGGPVINLAVGLLFVALWWLFPEIYPFTEAVVQANFSLATVNLIPAYPLDGGRVLSSALALAFGRERSFKICKVSAVVFSLLLISAFVFKIFT